MASKPITDPLHPDPSAYDHKNLDDDQFEDIHKGKAARNYKLWLIIGVGIVLGGILLIPNGGSKKKTDVVELHTPNEAKPGSDVVKELKSEVKPVAPILAPPQALDNALPGNGTPSALGAGLGRPVAGAGNPGGPGYAGKAEPTQAEIDAARTEAINASDTEASGVQVTRIATKAPRATDTDNAPLSDEDARSIMMKKQMALLDGLSDGSVARRNAEAQAHGNLAGMAQPGGDHNSNEGFLARAGLKGGEPATHVMAARQSLALYQGTIVRTVLDKGMNTDLPGSIRAHITSDVFDSLSQSRLLIPRGSVVIGEYNTGLVVGQDRILVGLSRLILPNGRSISLLGAPAEDMQGVSGMSAEVDNHFFKMFGSSLMIGAASLLMSRSAQNVTVNTNASGQTQTGGTILAQTLQQTIQQIAARNMNIKPTGTVEPGEAFVFTLSRDIEMEAYGTGPGNASFPRKGSL